MSGDYVTFMPAKHPIFEGVVDRRLCALIPIFLGCDVCIKGLPGVGTKAMNEVINVNYKKILQAMSKGFIVCLPQEISLQQDEVIQPLCGANIHPCPNL